MDADPARVLLLDADPAAYALARSVFSEIEEGRFALEWAATPEVGLETILRRQHDIYLLADRLGQRTGLEILRAARAGGCTAPFILWTGQADRGMAQEALRAGAADVLNKGRIDAPLLERVLSSAIERKRSEDLLRRMHAELELRVRERTAELARANEGLQTEIAERKRVAEAMRASEARKTAILETALDAVISIDQRGTIIEFNPAAERIFGYARSEALGAELADLLVPPRFRERQRHALERSRDAGAGRILDRRVELTAQRSDGGEFPVEVALTRTATDAGPIFTGYVRDITERKRAEEQRVQLLAQEQAARAEAERANRAKDEFLSVISHELRTPLTPILLWIGRLRGKRSDEATLARALETIERCVKLQAQLVEDLLDASRIITGKLRLDVRPVSLGAVVEAALDVVRPSAEAKQIALHSESDPALGPVSGDPARLQQIVWNLLSNALKFTPSGGRVAVRVEAADLHARIVVSDTGLGIEEEFLPYVFDRFRQADSTDSRTHGGLGLGLAIVRHLVELHGGNVRAESLGPGQGATFTVILPLAAAPVSMTELRVRAEHSTEDVSASASLAGLHVLLVEDDPTTRELLALVLSQAGAEVMALESAARALDVVPRWRPDVLVSDIGMPAEDGYSLIRKLRAEVGESGAARVPALALSGFAGAEDRERARSAGFQMHLAKPVDPDELIAAIAMLAARGVKG